jgi:alkylation response protein AidB-like acyl-CoA dehydrogenase
MKDSSVPAGGAFLLETADPRLFFIPEEFDSEDLLIAKTADDFLRKEVLPENERIEGGDVDLMARLMRRAGELGLLAADIPSVYGGLGLKQTTAALIAEKLNWQQSFALTHEAHTVIATLPLLFFGTDDQKRRYLPKLASGEWIGSFALSESGAGSDAMAAQTRATPAPDASFYTLNGTKAWITNTAFARLFTVFAKTDDGKLTAFLVERDFPGVSFGNEEHKLGMRGTSTRRIILDNVRVPAANAMEIGMGHYAAFCALNMGRFKLEAGATGGLKETLAVCAAYAKQRRAFGKTLSQFGLVQHKLAEMAARTFALESMVYRLAGCLERAFSPIQGDAPDASRRYHHAAEEYAVECSIVKVIGSETYSSMTDEAIQIHGGNGYTEEFPLARTWRDQRLLRIGEGANEVVRQLIVNALLRRDRKGRLAVRDAGERATSALVREMAPDAGLYDDPLDTVHAAAADAKQLALFLFYQASERLGADLAEAQEIVAAIADVVCSAYAIESAAVRCRKLRDRGHPRCDTALLAAQIASLDYAEEALRAGRYALDSLPAMDDVVDWRDEPFTGLSALLQRLGQSDVSPMQLRRELASQVLEQEGYPL